MIFWYDELLLDDELCKKKEICKRIIEKRSVWKKCFYLLTLAGNQDNLFEIICTDQMYFKHYQKVELYVVGISLTYDGAVEMLAAILGDGYGQNPDYNPRGIYTKERFSILKRKKRRR